MTVINDKRGSLTTALGEKDTTLLVISGESDADAKAIHDVIQARTDMEPWRRWFLIKKFATITPAERKAWFGGSTDGKYAVIGGGDPANGKPKRVGAKGNVSRLLRKNGKPSILRIRRVFAKGDQL
jgi:hypothetical protein